MYGMLYSLTQLQQWQCWWSGGLKTGILGYWDLSRKRGSEVDRAGDLRAPTVCAARSGQGVEGTGRVVQ